MILMFQMCVDFLPDQVIIEILKFLTVEDLALRVSEINPRWSELSSCRSLWRHLVFEPPDGMSDNQIIKVIQKAPFLRHFHLNHADNIHFIMQHLTLHCKDIRTIRMKWERILFWPWVPILVNICDNLESLECYVNKMSVTLDFMRYLGNLDDGKCFVVTGFFPNMETKSNRGKFAQSITLLLNEDVEKFFLDNRGLRHVAIGSKVTPRIIHQLYKYNNLQSLYVYATDGAPFEFDIAKLSCIYTLENLHLYFNHKEAVFKCNLISRVEFKRLVKLEILVLKTSLRIANLLPACKNLEFLRIISTYIYQEDLNGLEKCKQLKHLELNINYNEILSRIAKGCHELVFLDLSCLEIEANYTFNLELLRPCRKIRYLKLNYKLLNNSDLSAIPGLFQNLREICLFNCSKVSWKNLAKLKSMKPELRVWML